jgi:hypothetical protein
MNFSLRQRSYVAGVVVSTAEISGIGLLLAVAAVAQAPSPSARIVSSVENDKVVTLRGNVHPMAQPANDRGSLPGQQPVTKIHLLLQRSAAQETALRELLAQQQDPNSPKFHAWLTPQEFGQQFGPAESDVQAVKDWLKSQGFTDLKVNNGRTLIELNGTAGQVRNAFHTEIHRLAVNGKDHFANMQEPQIPAALAPVVANVAGLQNFHRKPMIHRMGKFRRDASTGQITPLFTFTDVNGTFFGVGPKDFATIYNVPTTFDGTGRSIAIVGQSNINMQDVTDFRTIFGLPAYSPDCSSAPCLSVILNGADPGLVSGDEGESDLDVEWAGAIAPKANIILVTSQLSDTDTLGGVDSSAEYIVDNNLADVMSDSYGSCESNLGTSGNAFYNALWQQAAAQGITVVVSAGDNGSAGCDDPNSATSAAGGIAVSGLASTPFNVAMGGTDFDQANIQSTFWNSTNGASTQVSAQRYIPEITWNDSCANAGLTGCNSVTSSSASLNIVAGSGGPSSIYTKAQVPWQSGFGDATARDLPDVSLFSSDGQNKSFYIVCGSDQDIAGDTGCNLTNFSPNSPFHDFQAVGGTSAAAPTFAAIMALVNQKTGQRQGNANITLYSLAKSESFASCNSTAGLSGGSSSTCVFNDITKGNISVPCTGASANCSKTTTGGFGVAASGGAPAFAAGTGYDLATGLGSVNVANLINKWSTASATGTGTTVTLSPATINGTAGSVSGTLTGAVTGSGGTPTGVVILENAITSAPMAPTSLNSGSYSLAASFLPTGTYTLKAHYSGDSTFAPSDSAPISVNLIRQASTVLVSFVDANGNLVTANQTVAYGSNYILRVDVGNASGTPCQAVSTGAVNFICPTGSVTLSDNGSALKDFPNAQTPNASSTSRLNDRGFTEDQPIQLNVGSHAIKASYAADVTSSYTSNPNSNTLTVNITQAITTTTVASSATSVASGGNVTLTAKVSSNSNSAQGPTGTVQFLNGTTNLGTAATCTPTPFNLSTGASAFCTATLTTALSSLPPGIINVRPRNTPFVLLAWIAAAFAMFSFVLTTMLAARRRQYAYFGLAFFLISAAALAGCGSSSTSTGGSSTGSARTITAKYSGDTNYASSTSAAVTVTVQ